MKPDSIIAERLAEMEISENESLYPPFPRILMFELVNACNHACIICASSQKTRKPGFMDAALFYRLIQEGYDLGARELALYSTGEPTLDKRLPAFVNKAKEIGYTYIYLTTNGSAELEFYHSLVQAGLHSLKFSINGITRDSYLLTHGKDNFDKAMTNLISLDKWRKENKHPLRLLVSFVYTKLTENEQTLAKEKIGPFVDDLWILPLNDLGGQMYEIYQILKPTDCSPPPTPKMAKPCFMLWKRMHISQDGYLTICCVDFDNTLAICDLNNMSLLDAWHHPLFAEIRKRHLSQQLDGTLCKNCLYQINEPFIPLNPALATSPDPKKSKRNLERVQKALKSSVNE